MAIPQSSGSTTSRPNEVEQLAHEEGLSFADVKQTAATLPSLLNAPPAPSPFEARDLALEAAAIETGEALGIGPELPTAHKRADMPFADLDIILPVEDIDAHLAEWTESPSGEYEAVNRFAESLSPSNEIVLLLDSLEQSFVTAGWTRPAAASAEATTVLSRDFDHAAAQFLRVGYAICLEHHQELNKIDLRPRPGSLAAAAAVGNDDGAYLSNWRLDPSPNTPQALALRRVLKLEASGWAIEAMTGNLTWINSAPSYGRLLADLYNPKTPIGWATAKFATRCFSAGVLAHRIEAEQNRDLHDVAALCIGPGASELRTGFFKESHEAAKLRRAHADSADDTRLQELVAIFRDKVAFAALRPEQWALRGYWTLEQVEQAMHIVRREQDPEAYDADGKWVADL